MKKKKGFTLIELLAVIVILAIIALIAVPVIMNIINKSSKSAFKDTAYGVINAGELYFAEKQLEPNGMLEDVTIELPDTTNTLELKGEVPDGNITITKEGKIALAVHNTRYCATKGLDDTDVTITEDYEICIAPGFETLITDLTLSETELELDLNDNPVAKVTATIQPTDATYKTLTWETSNDAVATVSQDGTITGVGTGTAIITVTTTDGSNISKSVEVDVVRMYTNGIMKSTNECIKTGTCTEAEIKTDEGIKVTINVKAGTPKDFYVLADDGNKLTLIMDRNLGDNVKWYDSTSGDNSHGPTKALEQLASLTNDWEIPEFTYTLSGLGHDGLTQRYPDSQVTAKARLITYAEANAVGCRGASGSCPDWMYANLYNTGNDNTYGHWTSTASGTNSTLAGYVHYQGVLDTRSTTNNYGLRPVIELSK